MSLVNSRTGEIVEQTEVLTMRGEVTTVALVLPDDLSFNEWEEYGRRLTKVSEGVMWWLGDWWRYGQRAYGEAAEAARPTGFSAKTVQNAAWVAGQVEVSRRRESLSFGHHDAVAALLPDDQDEVLALAETADSQWSVQDTRQEVRRRRTAERIGRAANEAPALEAQGLYQVLYADPPWDYEYAQSSTRDLANQYGTMSLEQICELDVPAADDSVLFLWATSPKLSESLEVVAAWGFTYRSCMVWVKEQIGMGYYARQQHELLLIAKRGELPVPAPENRPASVVVAPRMAHSAKPDEFAQLIEGMYPDLAKIELFARDERLGWATWGDQAPETV